MFSYGYGPEGQPGGIFRYATSADGMTWSEERVLAEPAAGHRIIARGFVERDGRLFAWYAIHTGDTFFRNGKEFADPAQRDVERNIAVIESEWLALTYCKRDIAVCSASADPVELERQAGFALLPRVFEGLCNRNLPRYLRQAAGYAGCREHFDWG